MHNDKPYSSYTGVFLCQRCSEEVTRLRFWHDTKDLTWQCSKKHISKVNMQGQKKTRKEYERAI